MTNRAVLLLGSNVDKERNLPAAVHLLRRLCRVVAVSPVYETAPVGLMGQPYFLNAAVLVETDLNASRLKETVMSQVEEELNRRRQSDRYAARTIDVDLLLFNDDVFTLGNRRIPDPDLRRYLHVAVPVADLLPDLIHPETGERIEVIVRRLQSEAVAAGQELPEERRDVSLPEINMGSSPPGETKSGGD
jgi:2-amino-4-hydroxy-6-hydroxymethyldihydropteridine diphosphokinase